jgi:environmental stress-induced protein Ves
MAVTLIRCETLAPSPWRNNAGRKADIAGGPGWSLGFAWLDADAPFSDFSGHDRTITLLSGPGFTLRFAAPAESLAITARHQPHPFDGGRPTRCHVLGPCRVLNAMTERPTHAHTVEIAHGPLALNSPETPFAVILDGPCPTPAGPAMPLDTIALTGNARLTLPRGTTAALIRFEANRNPGNG